MDKIFDREYVQISYDNAASLLYIDWKGIVSTHEFLAAMDFIYHATIQRNPDYLLIDTRLQAPVQKEATDYASEKMSMLLGQSIKKVFFILPLSVYTQMSLEMYKDNINNAEKDQKILYFSDPAHALALLEASNP
jgi:hypothetical protein